MFNLAHHLALASGVLDRAQRGSDYALSHIRRHVCFDDPCRPTAECFLGCHRRQMQVDTEGDGKLTVYTCSESAYFVMGLKRKVVAHEDCEKRNAIT